MKIDRYQMLYNLMERWLTLHEEGKTIPQILRKRGLSIIALYGLGKLGKHVVWEIKESDIVVLYAIDRVVSGVYDGITVKSVDEILPVVDAILVTAVYDFEEIEEILGDRVDCPIISLEEILYEG